MACALHYNGIQPSKERRQSDVTCLWSRTLETEAGEVKVQGQCELHTKSEASPGYMETSYLKKLKGEGREEGKKF